MLRTNQHNLWLASGGEIRRLIDSVRATNTETKKAVRAGNVSINGSFQDSLGAGGYTQLSLQNTLGRLNIRSAEARAIDTVSAKMQVNYYKLTANLNRTQYFNQQWSFGQM